MRKDPGLESLDNPIAQRFRPLVPILADLLNVVASDQANHWATTRYCGAKRHFGLSDLRSRLARIARFERIEWTRIEDHAIDRETSKQIIQTRFIVPRIKPIAMPNFECPWPLRW